MKTNKFIIIKFIIFMAVLSWKSVKKSFIYCISIVRSLIRSLFFRVTFMFFFIGSRECWDRTRYIRMDVKMKLVRNIIVLKNW